MVRCLFPDFFRFLDALEHGVEPWEAYCQRYLVPHRVFLTVYWREIVRMPESEWEARVRQVRPADYGDLRAALAVCDLVAEAHTTLQHAQAVAGAATTPPVYLFVGFFSPDAFTLHVGAEWAVAVGLERPGCVARTPLLLAHEFAHWLRRVRGIAPPSSVAEVIVEEGVATWFAQRVFPDRPLAAHLFVSPERLQWLRDTEATLWQRVGRAAALTDTRDIRAVVYGAPGEDRVPPRVGPYLGYRLVQRFEEQLGSRTVTAILDAQPAAVWATGPLRA